MLRLVVDDENTVNSISTDSGEPVPPEIAPEAISRSSRKSEKLPPESVEHSSNADTAAEEPALQADHADGQVDDAASDDAAGGIHRTRHRHRRPRSTAVQHPSPAHRQPAGRTAGPAHSPRPSAGRSNSSTPATSKSQRSFRIEQVAGGYQIAHLAAIRRLPQRLHQKEIDSKLTKAALETLAIIAYKQPILRADIEAIRGVACGETIRCLMEKHLVRIAGRAEVPGRPILYGTTKRFLELFGLNNLKDLPQNEEIKPPQAFAS